MLDEEVIEMLVSLFWVVSEGLGWCGLVLIAYGFFAAYTQPWPPLEAIAPFTSSLLTILGALLTAAAIYIPHNVSRPPWQHSMRLIAPIVMIGCAVAIFILFRVRTLPPAVVSGFGLLAISGGLKRSIPANLARLLPDASSPNSPSHSSAKQGG
jgi:hypothetical protein